MTVIRHQHRTWPAIAAAAGFVGIAAFEVALALGAPLGAAAFGGGSERLAAGLRVAAAAQAAVWLLGVPIVLGAVGMRIIPLPAAYIRWGLRILIGLAGIGALLNFASSSPWERFGWGPVALVEAALCALVARDRRSHWSGPR